MKNKLSSFEERLSIFKLNIVNKSIIDNKYILQDGDGYLYYLSNMNINTTYRRNGHPAIFFNLNPYTKENILNYIKINNINITLITTDFSNANAKTQLEFNCPIHGRFQKSWNEIKNGQYCPICGRIKCADNKRNKIEDIKIAFEKEGYILISDKYINNLIPLQYICKIHKDEGIQQMSWGSFITGQRCGYCTRERVLQQLTKSPEQFEMEVREKYGDKFKILLPYSNSKTKVKLYCNDCHCEFLQSPSHLLAGHIGCNCKSTSLGELKIKEILDDLNASYLQEYRFNDCKNKKKLPFDFAIFKDREKNQLEYLIEYQGIQHYKPARFGGISIEKSEKNYVIRQYNDKLKYDYCKANNIKLIRIPYWDFDNIEEILNKEIN